MEIKEILSDIHVRGNSPLCFSLDIKKYDKISCHFYDPRTLNLIKKLDKLENSVSLDEICDKVIYSDGKWELHTEDYVPEEFPDSVLLLQVLNLSEDGIIRTKYDKFIRKELHTRWKNSQIKPNDIVMAITGTIGLCALISEGFREANLNQALARIVLKEKIVRNGKEVKINPQFIVFYINSLYGRTQLERLGGSRAGQSGLSTTEIKSIKLPLPSYEIQTRVVNEVDAFKKKARVKIGNYKECLEKLKELLNSRLNIKKKDFGKSFIVKSSKLTDRLDGYFHHPELAYIQNEIRKLDHDKFEIVGCKELNRIKPIDKETCEKVRTTIFKYVDIGNTTVDLGLILGHEEDILLNLPTRARQLCDSGDLLQPRPIGSSDGLIIVPKGYDRQLFSTGFIQIRPKDEEEAFLLWVILKSEIVQKQLFYLQSGSVQPEITPTNFEEYVLIPIPKNTGSILTEARQYLKTAKELRIGYTKELDDAKNKFLELIVA
jgi:restriction endonuclease S subunit